jgi:hypothetical protein
MLTCGCRFDEDGDLPDDEDDDDWGADWDGADEDDPQDRSEDGGGWR